MPYHDYLGREQEDAEMDAMRQDRAAQEGETVGECPACGRVYTTSDMERASKRSPYVPCHPVRWQDLTPLNAALVSSLQEDQRAEVERAIATSVEQAEREGRESYSVCMRCGALFDGAWCPACD